MSGILGVALPRHQLPRRADRRRALRARDGDLAARPGGVRRAGAALPRGDRGDDAHPGHGREHRLRRLPAARRAAGGRRLPAAAAHLPGQPARLLARDRRPRPRGLAPHLGLRRQRHRPHPALRDRRLPVLHPVAGGDGAPVVEVGPARSRARRRGSAARSSATTGAGCSRWSSTASAPLLTARRDVRLRGDEVPRRGVGGADRHPRAGRRLLRDPPALPRPRGPPVARDVRPAAPGGPAPGDPPDQRRPPRGGGRAHLRAGPLGGRDRGLRLDRPRADRGGGEEVGAVGRRGAARGRRTRPTGCSSSRSSTTSARWRRAGSRTR